MSQKPHGRITDSHANHMAPKLNRSSSRAMSGSNREGSVGASDHATFSLGRKLVVQQSQFNILSNMVL